jgi:hypothetical protein
MGALGWFSAAFLPLFPGMRNQIGQSPGDPGFDRIRNKAPILLF